MKLEDFAYAVAQSVFHELEHVHHFVVPRPIREAVLAKIKQNLASLIKESR